MRKEDVAELSKSLGDIVNVTGDEPDKKEEQDEEDEEDEDYVEPDVVSDDLSHKGESIGERLRRRRQLKREAAIASAAAGE